MFSGPRALALELPLVVVLPYPEADVLLTSAYVAYATDLLLGQVDPKTISQAWHIPARISEDIEDRARTAAKAVLGTTVRVNEARGHALRSPDGSTRVIAPPAVAARPSAVAFESTGSYAPKPTASMRPGGRSWRSWTWAVN